MRRYGARGEHRLTPGEAKRAMPNEFQLFVAEVRGQVERRLAGWLDERVAEARARGSAVGIVADAVRQLALRGGKRMRPVLLAASYEACGGQGGGEAVAPAGVALELLQAYLLVHDDWMDGDPMRRGGPSVPALMRTRFSGPTADAMAILAGDLAAAWARRALFDVRLAPGRVASAARELARVEEEVVQGQVLDVAGGAGDAAEVEAMHDLKTTSYTVRGPVLMGALLADAGEAALESLRLFGDPVGLAFQLRDDLLGVFGDSAQTGKPAGTDLRAGKRTAVTVAALSRDPDGAVARVFGRTDASDGEWSAATRELDACGARAQIEARIDGLLQQAEMALARADVTAEDARCSRARLWP